jgi:hypothetical protein
LRWPTRRGVDGIATLDAAITDFDGRVASNYSCQQRFSPGNRRGSQHRRPSALLVHAVDIPLVYQVFRHQARAQSERSNLFHRMVRDAIVAGEPRRAGALMAKHILQGRDALQALTSAQARETQIHAS